MNWRDKISILIPTHNRHLYLDRLLNYFSPHHLKIFIADSSASPYQSDKFPSAIYQHLPELSYYQKIWKVLNEIETPYVVLCPDDDFTIPEAMEECVQFLEAHTDYASA